MVSINYVVNVIRLYVMVWCGGCFSQMVQYASITKIDTLISIADDANYFRSNNRRGLECLCSEARDEFSSPRSPHSNAYILFIEINTCQTFQNPQTLCFCLQRYKKRRGICSRNIRIDAQYKSYHICQSLCEQWNQRIVYRVHVLPRHMHGNYHVRNANDLSSGIGSILKFRTIQPDEHIASGGRVGGGGGGRVGGDGRVVGGGAEDTRFDGCPSPTRTATRTATR